MKSGIRKKQTRFSKLLLEWRKENNFDQLYPWRNTGNKYRILLSELLLKKTTRKQVAQEWRSIVNQCSSFEEIVTCDLRTLKKVLRPLGLENTRSKSLKDISKKITTEFKGRVPKTKESLLSLPGVGPYTANAVLCFAFGHDVSMLDVNIMRVLCRVFSVDSKSSERTTGKSLLDFAESLPPRNMGKEFNYAILDFAGDVCTSRKPNCDNCPLKQICDYV